MTCHSDDLFNSYRNLAVGLASRMYRALGGSVAREDLIASAIYGLFLAAQNYDPALGTFPAYAQVRIRGAMLDELRSIDLLSRRARRSGLRLVGVHHAEHEPSADNPEQSCGEAEMLRLAASAMRKLSYREEHLLRRAYLGGERFDLIARDMGISKVLREQDATRDAAAPGGDTGTIRPRR